MAKTALNALRALHGERPLEDDDVLHVEGATKGKQRSVLSGQLAGGATAADYAAEDVGNTPVVEGDSLAALQSLAAELINEGREVQRLDGLKKAAEGRLMDIAEKRLPDMMEKNNLPKFEFFDRTTGATLIIKLESDKWRVTMPPLKDKDGEPYPNAEENRAAIFAWLREIGLGGIISKDLKVPLGLVDDEATAALLDAFRAANPALDPAIKEDVNQKRLQSQVTRLLKDGKTVHGALQVKAIRQAKVAAK